MRVLDVAATVRASWYLYNDRDDIDALADALDGASDIFGFPPASEATERPAMPGLEDLYREIILDHYRSPRNRGELPAPPAAVAQGHNPLCGDEITVYLLVDDGRVDDVKVGGQGCSISQSSASMMSQAIKGRSVDEVRALVRRFKGMMSIDDVGRRRRRRRR